MGVTGLWKLVEPCGSPVPIETLEGKILAVDISIWLHQVVKGFQDNKGSVLPYAHLLGLFHRLCKLLYYRIRPVFVFDGCVPDLKRDTIARRHQQRHKINNEVNRIQALLLQSLAKEEVVQRALGGSTQLLMKSPSKSQSTNNQNENTKDDMFKLPDLPAITVKGDDQERTDTSTDTFSETSEGDSSFDDSNTWREYNANIQAIDVRSEHFKSLPPEIRHEILVDIKDTRKQSSWGRLHELPSCSYDFSSFQMKRLLKRRAVQESLEETEKEMGEQALTYTDLQNFFAEEGILDPQNLNQGALPLCSDEAVRFTLVRELRKNSNKDGKCKIEPISKEKKLNVDELCTTDNNSSKDDTDRKITEHDIDLEVAIANSLENESQIVYNKSDYEYKSNHNIKLNPLQRKQLKSTTIGPARTYMIEYGGMNDDEVEGIMDKTEIAYDTEDEDVNIAKAIAESLKAINTEREVAKSSETTQDICLQVSDSSETDSDLEEVVEEVAVQLDTKEDICLRVSDNSETDSDLEEVVENAADPKVNKQSSKNTLEVVIKTQDLILPEEDIFSDIFQTSNQSSSQLKQQDRIQNMEDKSKNTVKVENVDEKTNKNSYVLNDIKKQDPQKNDDNYEGNTEISSILNELKRQANEVEKINLDVIDIESPNNCEPIIESNIKNDGVEKLNLNVINTEETSNIVLNNENNIEISSILHDLKRQANEVEKISLDIINIDSPDNSEPIIESSKEISSILHDLKNQANEVENINLDNIDINKRDGELTQNTEVIEIYDSDDQRLILETTPSKSPKQETPSKTKTINEYFETKYMVKRTPESNMDKSAENRSPHVKSPFFVKKSPASNHKRSAEKNKESSALGRKLSKASKTLFENEPTSAENALGSKRQDTRAITEGLLKDAAGALKEQKSTEELKELAQDLAKERSNLENERNRQDRMGTAINKNMHTECQELLRLFGIPYVIAPMEAEAQCAFLESVNLTHGTITDDSDIWLFGGRTVYKNFFEQNKHVLKFDADKISQSFNCDRQKLIQLACLVGSDYTTGIHGIGTVTALEILATFSAPAKKLNDFAGNNTSATPATILSVLYRFRDWLKRNKDSTQPVGSSTLLNLRKKLKNIELFDGFPNPAVIEAYLSPTVDESKASFSWGYPDVDSIHNFTKKVFGWTTNKTDDLLKPVLKRLNDKQTQSSIRNYFTVKSVTNSLKLKVSKRVQKAIATMAGELSESEVITKANKQTKQKGRRKKQNESNETEKQAEVQIIDTCMLEGPSTSVAALEHENKKRKPRIPETKQVIPQREHDKEIMRLNKKKAIALIRKSTTTTTRKGTKKSRTD
ncbi:DNA repair protein complementing XP-G cells homolog [Ceratitis capitata]|uniref:DNA repair protein complementing XP-G cells homolog n=1 Tax=Ceratitis capitata TaxID=7213 RepID=UPI000329F3A8|nr:DNA repair protein complementing XP-G cells homolog [Ceratitis capitata]